MSDMTPVYLRVGEVARILRWDRNRARRWLKKAGCIVVRGGKSVVPVERLKLEFPEVYERISQEAFEEYEFGQS